MCLCYMEKKASNATRKRPEGERVLDSEAVALNLANYINLLLKEDTWKEQGKNAITIFKTDTLTITLIILHKGAVIEAGKPDGIGTTSIQLLKGILTVHFGGHHELLTEGHLIALHEKKSFILTSEQEVTALLLTMTNIRND